MEERSIQSYKTLNQWCFAIRWILPILGVVVYGSCSTTKSVPASHIQEPENVLSLEPGQDNPRNSEGDFIRLKNGDILFVYTHYYGNSSSDHGSAYLASRRSKDEGRTWTTSDHVALENEGDMNVMSVSLLRLQSGQIALFYLRKNATDDCLPYLRISTDEAKTWGDPILCVPDQKGYFILNNDRVIQLENGRIMMAVSQHNTPGGKFSLNGNLYCYFSDDNGATWSRGEMVRNPGVVLQEPGLVELEDGSILMFSRSDCGTQCFTLSQDRGLSWGPVTKSQLISPRSPATIERIPKTGDLLAIWNYNRSTDKVLSTKRTPLNVAISRDEGVSWSRVKTIEADPDGWYCYIAMEFVGDDVLLGYCAGSQSGKTGLAVTDIKRISLDWIYQ